MQAVSCSNRTTLILDDHVAKSFPKLLLLTSKAFLTVNGAFKPCKWMLESTTVGYQSFTEKDLSLNSLDAQRNKMVTNDSIVSCFDKHIDLCAIAAEQCSFTTLR